MKITQPCINVAIAFPKRQTFDYLVPAHLPMPQIGCRVRVPFGKRECIGFVVDHGQKSHIAPEKIKSIHTILDQEAILPESVWFLIHWTAEYYHHPIGDTLFTALPNDLNKGKPCILEKNILWKITEKGLKEKDTLPKRAVKLRRVMTVLETYPQGLEERQLKVQEISLSQLNNLKSKEWVIDFEEDNSHCSDDKTHDIGTSIVLNKEQEDVIHRVQKHLTEFYPCVLFGITGSGKTEVYLQLIRQVIQKNKQALVLIPEIGLSPQTLSRFEKQFPGKVGLLHSQLTDRERLQTWLKAKEGVLQLIIGTRSAIFTPFKQLGIIIVDEEQDLSYKQQDGLRYSSRDLSVIRAQKDNIPVILGSATPSLETLNNVAKGRYHQFILNHRAIAERPPNIHLLDCKSQPMESGLSHPLIHKIKQHLENNHQVLVFINRRGFSPILMCHQCSQVVECQSCDIPFTLHQSPSTGEKYLQCHRCGKTSSYPKACQSCGSSEFIAIGQGTERVEQTLKQLFPEYAIQRIDRDTTRKKQAMQQYVEEAKSGQTKLLVGTQMLAKGHHFPNLTLVAILDIDGALFSSDFRAIEKTAQLVIQVAGRAGRSEHAGEVIIQTHHPQHPLLQQLCEHDYARLAEPLLDERNAANLPPFYHMCILHAESIDKVAAKDFLQKIKKYILNINSASQFDLLGPIAAPISRSKSRYRYQLILNSVSRKNLQGVLIQTVHYIETELTTSKIRWSLDKDPLDLL